VYGTTLIRRLGRGPEQPHNALARGDLRNSAPDAPSGGFGPPRGSERAGRDREQGGFARNPCASYMEVRV